LQCVKFIKQLESAQGWIAQPAAPEWGGGTKSPEHTRARPKKVSVRPLMDCWTGVVTKIGPHGGQHARTVFESDCESNEVR